MRYLNVKNSRLVIIISLICIALIFSNFIGCARAGANMSGLQEVQTENKTSAQEDENDEQFDLCFGSVSDSGESYFLFDLDAKYIKFFSTLPGVIWFEDYYSGDLEEGLSISIGNDFYADIYYADSTLKTIIADYSYGESYLFKKYKVEEATALLDEDGNLTEYYQKLMDAAESTTTEDYFQITDVTQIDFSFENSETDVSARAYEEPVIYETNPEYDETTVYEEPYQEESPVSYTFVLNTNSKKIHTTGCRGVKQMKESNKLFVQGTLEEIFDNYPGYTVCGICNARY